MAERPIALARPRVQAPIPHRFNVIHLPTEGMVQHEDLVDIFAEVLAPFADMAHVFQAANKEGNVLHDVGSLLERMEAGAFQLALRKIERLMPSEVVHRG